MMKSAVIILRHVFPIQTRAHWTMSSVHLGFLIYDKIGKQTSFINVISIECNVTKTVTSQREPIFKYQAGFIGLWRNQGRPARLSLLLTHEKQEIVNADLTYVRIEEKFRLLVGQTVNVKLPDYNHTEEVIYAFRTNSLESGSLRDDSHWTIISKSDFSKIHVSQWKSSTENISIRARNWTKHATFLIIWKAELWLLKTWWPFLIYS